MVALWDVLGQKHSIDLLIRIYQNPGMMQKDTVAGPGKTVRIERLEDLVNAGLIKTDSAGGNWIAIRYFVTDEGARIARGLISIERGSDVMETDYGAPASEGGSVKGSRP